MTCQRRGHIGGLELVAEQDPAQQVAGARRERGQRGAKVGVVRDRPGRCRQVAPWPCVAGDGTEGNWYSYAPTVSANGALRLIAPLVDSAASVV